MVWTVSPGRQPTYAGRSAGRGGDDQHAQGLDGCGSAGYRCGRESAAKVSHALSDPVPTVRVYGIFVDLLSMTHGQ